jgi:phage terminase large subunit-like protein
MTLIREFFVERLEQRPELEAQVIRALTPKERDGWTADWPEWAHPGQLAPAGDWRTWVLMAGRGFGKTRAGAQWVDALVRVAAVSGEGPVRIALVAATDVEARRVMIEGASGLLSIAAHASERPVFEPSRGRLVWPGGSEATLYSGANPEALRGPEHHYAWCDELAKWRHPQATWDNLQLGLRAGAHPRALVTTTPRAGSEVLKLLRDAEGTVVTRGASRLNPHVPDAWLEAMEDAYLGTAQGRQELEGELIDDVAGTLWPAALIEASRGAMPARARLVRVVIGVDPPASAQGTCGIVACGIDADDVAHVLADHSRAGLSPEGWARAVAAAVERHEADRVVAESNQGGDMVRAVLAGAGVRLGVKLATALDGKAARAEPVAALFECGKARLAGRFPALEAELAGMIAGGRYEGPGRSPDRADAMVWAMTALVLGAGGEPRIWKSD